MCHKAPENNTESAALKYSCSLLINGHSEYISSFIKPEMLKMYT